MPSALTYPGVYVEEVPSGVRTITGVATSITAFIGRSSRGPVNRAVRVQSFTEYARIFGGLWRDSTMSYAVSHFFQHGGADALIVRVFNGDIAASVHHAFSPHLSWGLRRRGSQWCAHHHRCRHVHHGLHRPLVARPRQPGGTGT